MYTRSVQGGGRRSEWAEEGSMVKVVGIEVSKDTLDVADMSETQHSAYVQVPATASSSAG